MKFFNDFASLLDQLIVFSGSRYYTRYSVRPDIVRLGQLIVFSGGILDIYVSEDTS